MPGAKPVVEARGAANAAMAALAPVFGPRVSGPKPLGPLTTYRVGGPAAVVVTADSVDELRVVGRVASDVDLPVLVVGKGSNLLVAEAGFPGIAVLLGPPFEFIDVSGTGVRAGGAASLPTVARRAAAAGLAGFEWAVGVPGSIGGAVRMNAGGHGSDMATCLRRCTILDLPSGEQKVWSVAQLGYGYRRSSVGAAMVVVDATIACQAGERSKSEAAIAEIVTWRREHQPGGRNAGSVFTNPAGDSAGRLVEASGCKGLRRGTAVVSDKHANFIQADERGSADDVYALIVEVAELVAARQGVNLATEVQTVGFPPRRSHPPVEAQTLAASETRAPWER